jgi:hypothetical protein
MGYLIFSRSNTKDAAGPEPVREPPTGLAALLHLQSLLNQDSDIFTARQLGRRTVSWAAGSHFMTMVRKTPGVSGGAASVGNGRVPVWIIVLKRNRWIGG